jgi:chromatin remodeling complex protein RSC6
MTSQSLAGILKILDSLDQNLRIQPSLEAVRDALENLTNTPAQSQYQSTLASTLTAFTDAATKMAESITPSQAASIAEMGGGEFFDPAIADKVKNSVQMNAATLSVARDFVKDLAARRATFLATVRSTRQGLEKLGITDSGGKPGTADVAFLIPRNIFDNKLNLFAKELTFLSRLIQDFTEAQTGTAEPPALEQLSSSVPHVAVLADLGVLSLLGTVINKFLKAWQQIEEIRSMRAKLATMGLKGAALQELTDQITTNVTNVIEESTTLVIANYNGNRKHELENAIRSDTKRLFGQIEQGLTVEFRVEPQPGKVDGENQQKLQNIANVAKELKFPLVSEEPLLLGTGELLEDIDGDSVQVVKQTRKTTTQKTTASKKSVQDEGKRE